MKKLLLLVLMFFVFSCGGGSGGGSSSPSSPDSGNQSDSVASDSMETAPIDSASNKADTEVSTPAEKEKSDLPALPDTSANNGSSMTNLSADNDNTASVAPDVYGPVNFIQDSSAQPVVVNSTGGDVHGLSSNGYVLPSDPGPLANATVEGVDVNQNSTGVKRDDLEIRLSQEPDGPAKDRLAIMLEVIEDEIEERYDAQASISNAENENLLNACVHSFQELETASHSYYNNNQVAEDEWDKALSWVVNTQERIDAYNAYLRNISGHSFQLREGSSRACYQIKSTLDPSIPLPGEEILANNGYLAGTVKWITIEE